MKISKWVWGTFLLLVAAFVLSNQFGGFVNISIGSIIVAFLALAFIVQCLTQLSFAPLPIPAAVLYIAFQKPLDLPYLQTWTLILAAVLTSVALVILLPKKHRWHWREHTAGDGKFYSYGPGKPLSVSSGGSEHDNNPVVSVNFGATSRYLHSDCLETARLSCSFGAMEVYFDQAQLSPDGANVVCDCSFGAIEMIVPRHWDVIDRINCSLGGVDINRRFAAPAENAPRLTLTGNVSLGGIDVKFI